MPGPGGNEGGPMDWFNQLPKLSRSYALAILCTAACISYGYDISFLALDWSKVIKGFQVWRLLTHILIAGKLGFPLLMPLISILQYGATLERTYYATCPEDFVFMFLFGAAGMAAISGISGPLLGLAYLPISGHAMITMLTYVWSKEYPEQDIAFYGVIKFKGFWLPFILLGLSVVLDQKKEMQILCGMFVGHLWYFFTVLLPRGTGQATIRTPAFCRQVAEAMQMSGAAAGAVRRPGAAAGAAPAAGRRFQGGGQRLGSG